MRLIAKERILLYLLEAAPPQDTAEVSPALTQDGVAQGSWIEVRHVRQFVRPLLEDGLVQERQAHVIGTRQRRKVYELTEAGRVAAFRLRQRVGASVLQVQDDTGTRETTLADALRLAGGQASLLGLVRRAQEAQPVELGGGVSVPPTSLVAMVAGAPRLKNFVGRRRELQLICAERKGPRVFVVRGVAGIGKSSLAAAACEALRGTRNLYWRRVRPWDSSATILAGLGEFLAALGRRDMRAALGRGETGRAVEALRRDLAGTRSFLVFDDAHEASPDALSGFRVVVEAIGEARDVRALFLTRRSLRFYDRRDVEIAGLAREMDLEGLEPSEVAALMAVQGRDPQTAKLARRLGGHPLFLELLRSSDPLMGGVSRLTSVRNFIDEEVYRDLSGPERTMMKLAALYRTPVPSAALFGVPGLTYDALLALRERALIRAVGEESFEVHDTIRDYFESILTDEEKTSLAGHAIRQLRSLAARAEGSGDYPTAVDCLSNALRLPMPAPDRTTLLEALGDVQECIGNLPEMLDAYKEGIRSTEDPVIIARLHRKTARAFLARDDPRPASAEVEAGLVVLGAIRSVERGWLEGMRGVVVAETDRTNAARAIASLHAGMKAFREHGEKVGEMETLIFLGYYRQFLGDLDDAERCYREALELAISVADQRFMADAHGRLAYFYAFWRPDLDKALDHLRAMESLARHLDYYRRSYAAWWKGLIRAELLGDYPGAEASLNDYVALARETYDAGSIFTGNGELANLAYYRGRIAEARGRYEGQWREAQVARWMSCNWPIEHGVNSLWMAAECCLQQGDRPGFERLAAELDRQGMQERMTHRTVMTNVLRGLQAFVQGDEDGFEAFFAHGLEAAEQAFQARTSPHEVPAYLIPYFYGVALLAQGRADEASAHIDRALGNLNGYGLKVRRETLLHAQERFVQVLRDWAR